MQLFDMNLTGEILYACIRFLSTFYSISFVRKFTNYLVWCTLLPKPYFYSNILRNQPKNNFNNLFLISKKVGVLILGFNYIIVVQKEDH